MVSQMNQVQISCRSSRIVILKRLIEIEANLTGKLKIALSGSSLDDIKGFYASFLFSCLIRFEELHRSFLSEIVSLCVPHLKGKVWAGGILDISKSLHKGFVPWDPSVGETILKHIKLVVFLRTNELICVKAVEKLETESAFGEWNAMLSEHGINLNVIMDYPSKIQIYLQIVNDLIKCSGETHFDNEHLHSAKDCLTIVTEEIKIYIERKRYHHELLQVEAQFAVPQNISTLNMDTDRRYIKQGELFISKMSFHFIRTIILLTDALIISKMTRKGLVLEHKLNVALMVVFDLPGTTKYPFTFRIESLDTSIILSANSFEEKHDWTVALRKCINEIDALRPIPLVPNCQSERVKSIQRSLDFGFKLEKALQFLWRQNRSMYLKGRCLVCKIEFSKQNQAFECSSCFCCVCKTHFCEKKESGVSSVCTKCKDGISPLFYAISNENANNREREVGPKQRVLMEIIETEEFYIAQLQLFDHLFAKPVLQLLFKDTQNLPVPFRDPQFAKHLVQFSTLINLHLDFLNALRSSPMKTAKVFIRYCFFWKIYKDLVETHLPCNQIIDLPECESFVQKFERDARCQGQMLRSFLILPIQRIPRYLLLARQMQIHSSGKERIQWEFAIECIEKTIQTINSAEGRSNAVTDFWNH